MSAEASDTIRIVIGEDQALLRQGWAGEPLGSKSGCGGCGLEELAAIDHG